MVAETVASKKMRKKVKRELLNSLRKNAEVEETEINKGNVIDRGEAIQLIILYEEINMTQRKRVRIHSVVGTNIRKV